MMVFTAEDAEVAEERKKILMLVDRGWPPHHPLAQSEKKPA